jgi:hypothetical protein
VPAGGYALSVEGAAAFTNFVAAILAADFAASLGIRAPLACGAAVDDCPAGGSCTDRNGDAVPTGVCVPENDPIFFTLAFFDADRDGRIEVDFDPAAGLFDVNEMAAFFDIGDDGPSGVVGDLFRLDLNGDGARDALGVALGFTAAPARNREP